MTFQIPIVFQERTVKTIRAMDLIFGTVLYLVVLISSFQLLDHNID